MKTAKEYKALLNERHESKATLADIDRVIARYAFYAFGGVAILGIEYGIEDKIKWAWEDTGTGLGRVNTSRIRYDKNGESHFIAGGQRVPLAECLKVGEPA